MRNELVLGESLAFLIDHRGKTPKKLGSDFSESGVPVASAIMVKDGRLDLTEARYVDQGTFERWMPVHVKPGDVLLTSEAPLGRLARVRHDAPLVLGQRLFGLRGSPGVLDSGYLYYALQSDRVQSDLAGRSTGTTVLGIRQTALRSLRIPAPSYPEQQAIAEVLSVLDDKITENRQVVGSAWNLARASFARDAFDVDSVPTTIGEASTRGWLRFSDGYRTKGSEYQFPGLRILRAGDLQPNRILATGEDYVSYGYLKPIGAKASQEGDIVVSTKGTVGRVAVVPQGSEQFVYSPQLCFFRVLDQDHLNRGFLAGWFRSASFVSQADARMFKSDMAPYINLDDIRSMSVPIPRSTSVQHRIGGLQVELERMAHSKDRENSVLASTRDELLPLLMSGTLRVKDAEKVVEDVV